MTTTYNLKQKIELINQSKEDIKSAIESKIEDSINEEYEILGNITTYANEINKIVTPNNQTLDTITENGTYIYDDTTYTGLNNITVNLPMMSKTITENGEYSVTEDNVQGYNNVLVSVNQTVEDIAITENGTYTASASSIGFGEVTVNVQPQLATKFITNNGIYKAEDVSLYGFDKVIVDVEGANTFLVKVIDYDGTILKLDRLKQGDTFELPSNPTHSGLIFQEWVSPITIIDNTITVEDYDIVIGASYKNVSGLSEFDITLTKITGLTLTLNMNGLKDWGDGTSDSEITHTYSDYGDYTISCDGLTFSATQQNPAFLPATCLTNIRLNNVVNIADYTFRNCKNLKEVILYDIVQIGVYAFDNCYSLNTIILPNTTTILSNFVFAHCVNLETIVIPNVTVNFGKGVFQYCTSLKDIYIYTFEDKKIPEYFFDACTALQSFKIPNNIITIETYAFRNCGIKTVYLPSSVKYLGSSSGGAFQECVNLKNMIINNGLETIYSNNFKNCIFPPNFNLYIPDTVTSIESSTFYGTQLDYIRLPKFLTQIGNSMFFNSRIKSIKIPKYVTDIGSQAFLGCSLCLEYDFSEHDSIPTLSGIKTFDSINDLCKIKVPSELYDDWITATNWVTYANYIVGV